MKNLKIKLVPLAVAMLFAVVGAFATIGNGAESTTDINGQSPLFANPCALTTECTTIQSLNVCLDVNSIQAFAFDGPTCDVKVYARTGQ